MHTCQHPKLCPTRSIFHLRSLNTRVTFFTLAMFIVSIWSLEFYSSRMLRQDLLKLLSDQQFSTASFAAAWVNNELSERRHALEKVADRMSPALLATPAVLQAFLDDRLALNTLFNGGIIAIGLDGTAVAEVPLSAGRIGVNYMDRDFIISTLKEGKSTISRPVIGKTSKIPLFDITTPIRDQQGNVIGALLGVTNLDKPNFLDKITEGSYGKTGGYYLIAPQERLIVTASDKKRIMNTLPAPGIIPAIDRVIQGEEFSTIYVNPLGVEVLASAKWVPAAGWFVGITLPTEEAFGPIRDMQQRMTLAAILLTLLTGILTLLLLKRMLAPMLTAVKTLASLATTNLSSSQLLPNHSQDEIGDLIAAFNHLLQTLEERRKALEKSELQFRSYVENANDVLFALTPAGIFSYVSPQWQEAFGYEDSETIGQSFQPFVHPDDVPDCLAFLQQVIDTGLKHHGLEFRVRCKNGVYRRYRVNASSSKDPVSGALSFVGIGRDITERKQAEAIIQARLNLIDYAIHHSIDELLTKVLDETEALTGSSIGFFHFLDASQQTLSLQTWSTNTLSTMCSAEGKGQHYPIDKAGVWADCVRTRQPIIHNDYAALPNRQGMPPGHAAVLRELTVPIFRGDLIVGILGVGNKPQEYDALDISAVNQLANQAWDLVSGKQKDEALHKSEGILNSSQHLAKIGGWQWDCLQQTMYWTEEVYRIHDMESSQVTPGSPEHIEKSLNCYAMEDRQNIKNAFQRCAEYGEEYDLEFPFTSTTGRSLWVRTLAQAVWDRDRIVKIIGNFIDITERKQAEMEILRALQEKNVMLKEIHHRVKNNMQVVYSILSLQAMKITEPSYRAMFEESKNRILAMAMIHETLYKAEDLGHIAFKPYLKGLLKGIEETYRLPQVLMVVEMEDLTLDINTGIPCGLIVTELVTNSLKYAFPEGRKGLIKVGIKNDNEGNNILTVIDNGIGFPAELDFRSTQASFGLQIINGLTKQIHGTIDLSRSDGTSFSITFPETIQRRSE